MTQLSLAFSPCPNDTFMFHAMVHGLTNTDGLTFTPELHDVGALNIFAFSERFDITKLSFFAYLKLKGQYTLLDAGAALGFGCGPLLVARNPDAFTPEATIAIPGALTTANLLLKLWNLDAHNTVVTRFDNILKGVADGTYDAGLIIHEGRFIYQDYGCREIVDLGRWWEERTGLPIPLGCIAIRNASPVIEYKDRVQTALKDSIHYAFTHPQESRDYIKQHAQEIDDAVIADHIKLYVNEFSLGLGEMGRRSIAKLEEMAAWADVL